MRMGYSYNIVQTQEHIKQDNQRKISGRKTVIGAILIQLAVGSYHGTFGNLLPYFTSFMRQVIEYFSLYLAIQNSYTAF